MYFSFSGVFSVSGFFQIRYTIAPRKQHLKTFLITGVPRATYSTSDITDPLNAEIDDEIYIDTKDLCKRVAYELKVKFW